MAYDYRKLSGRIVEKFGSQALFATEMGFSEHTLSAKLNNKVGFKQKEIQRAVAVLDIPEAEISEYFFTIKVQLS